VEDFFNRLGFTTVDRWALSPKIWHECIYCPKFDACDEIAVLMDLVEPEAVPAQGVPALLRPTWISVRP